MYYILWGVGGLIDIAMDYLGHRRISYLIDNNPDIVEHNYKPVISYEQFLKREDKEDYIVVITSVNYAEEMKRQLEKDKILKFFIFNPEIVYHSALYLPNYYIYKNYEQVTYARILANKNISRYRDRRILIYGSNPMLPYLISEISIQASYKAIKCVATDEANSDLLGVSRIKTSEINKRQFDVIIINKRMEEMSYEEQKQIYAMETDIVDIYDADCVEKAFFHPELVKYKNIHKGKRIFIICNGPSLTIDDLETLHNNNEICIGLNKIYRIYDTTNWRADYLAAYDQFVVMEIEKDYEKIEGKIFVGDSFQYEYPMKDNKYEYFHVKSGGKKYGECLPKFSSDFCEGFYEGFTVTYTFALQFAMYTGATDIYIIGCDHSFRADMANNYFSKKMMTIDEVRKRDKILYSRGEKKLAEAAYKSARQYAEKNGIKIFNATRGGALEIFERVDFDTLFN